MFNSLLVSLALFVAPSICPWAPYRPPVDAPIADVFRLPDGPFGAGNRGLEYRTDRGQPVWAIAAGEVTFAGSVAGERYVSIRHGDGLVASYSYLERITVERGAPVAAGVLVGTTTARFQLGLRRDGIYIDPAPLLDRRGRARLVPNEFPAMGQRC